MLAKENEETCFPSFGLIEILGTLYSVEEGGAGSGLDCSISEFVTSCVSSTVFLGDILL